MTSLNLCPSPIDICVTRGDTVAWAFAIKSSSGTAVDITGFSYLLTVDPERHPTASTNNVFQLTGTVTDAVGGVVQFEMSAVQADQSGMFYFDLQQTDSGGSIRTIAKGSFEFRQDITK